MRKLLKWPSCETPVVTGQSWGKMERGANDINTSHVLSIITGKTQHFPCIVSSNCHKKINSYITCSISL